MSELVTGKIEVSAPIISNYEESIRALKPPVSHDALQHKVLRADEFWRGIPGFSDIDAETFYDYHWQAKNSVTCVNKLVQHLQEILTADALDDIKAGLHRAPMTIRISPYLLGLIDWNDFRNDPIRKQFLPIGSVLVPDHPKLGFDSLNEQGDSPVPGLTHRYPDKALFLALDTCPVYCRFCTRSYVVGINTERNKKISLRANAERWSAAFNYIASRPELEDIVVSGGDSYQLRPVQIREIGETLLAMPNIQRIRFATKGPLAIPQKIITDHEWRNALIDVVNKGRKLHKEVVLHTHFNHPNEITEITRVAMNMLMEEGVIVRNQSVLQRGVNDNAETIKLLVKRLSYINVTPYYVYVHDLVHGVEDLRTSVQAAINIEKQVRGATAGFNTPAFVVDAPGGGGKRDVHSFEHYDRETGISVYKSPSVNNDLTYLYFDPLHTLSDGIAKMWGKPDKQKMMIDDALKWADLNHRTYVGGW